MTKTIMTLFLIGGSLLASSLMAAQPPVPPAPAAAQTPQALHQAVLRGDLMPVQALLADPRINPDQTDPQGSTPLHLAVLDDQPAMVRLLLAHHADVNLRDARGHTPLDLARSWSIWWLLVTQGSMPGNETWVFLAAMVVLMILGILWLRNRPQPIVQNKSVS